MIIVVGSRNPVKVRAVHVGLSRVIMDDFTLVETSLDGYPDVIDQPMSMSETWVGARRRAMYALQQCNGDLGVGLEGGLAQIEDEWFCVSCVAIADSRGMILSAMGPAVYVPAPIIELVQTGMELGDADDQYFGLSNSKQAGGLVGTITDGLVTREDGFTQAVIIAMKSVCKQEVLL
jgi:inosine/xanthosine triphosphatase